MKALNYKFQIPNSKNQATRVWLPVTGIWKLEFEIWNLEFEIFPKRFQPNDLP
jgi:hypothetical protein